MNNPLQLLTQSTLQEFDKQFLGTDDIEFSETDIRNGTVAVYAYAAKKFIIKAQRAAYLAGITHIERHLKDYCGALDPTTLHSEYFDGFNDAIFVIHQELSQVEKEISEP